MKMPDEYKRNYRFKTDNSKERKVINITIILIIFGLMAWYAAEYFA